jgi:diguanylate cyclase (GGDEF)-like protein
MVDTTSRKKPLLWVIIIGVLITVLVAYFLTQWTRNTLLSELHHRALDELKVHIAHIKSEMGHLHTLTRIVAKDERVISFLNTPSGPGHQIQVNRYLKRLKDVTGIIPYIINTTGQVLASGNWDMPDSFVGHDLGFRPYFVSSIQGEDAQYVAVGAISNRLGYYVSTPIRMGKKIIGVAATKTDPQDLIMSHEQHGRPLIITDPNGVAIISSAPEYLFHTLAPHTDATFKLRSKYSGRKLKPITTTPVKKVGQAQLLYLSSPKDGYDGSDTPKQYLLARAALSHSEWKAHIFWPVEDLETPLMQRQLISVLSLILAWLLCFYAVERWQHVKQIQEHAFRDPLTRVYTRLYMLESATALLAAHDRNSISGVSAIMFDLDRFKTINDQYGHSAGDNVLVQAADVLIKECRESDIPIRYGGEEFLVFVPTGDHQQVFQLAERIRHQIKNLDIKLAGKSVPITISGGIAVHMPGEMLEKLIDRADQMMYLAKQSGRDQIKMET